MSMDCVGVSYMHYMHNMYMYSTFYVNNHMHFSLYLLYMLPVRPNYPAQQCPHQTREHACKTQHKTHQTPS